MNTIVFGRSNALACNDATSFYDAGMCDVFPRIQPANVSVSYISFRALASQAGWGDRSQPSQCGCRT